MDSAVTYNFIDAMNSNWTKWAPLLLEFYEYENYNLDEVSEKIKEEYFKGSLLTKDNYKTLVKVNKFWMLFLKDVFAAIYVIVCLLYLA